MPEPTQTFPEFLELRNIKLAAVSQMPFAEQYKLSDQYQLECIPGVKEIITKDTEFNENGMRVCKHCPHAPQITVLDMVDHVRYAHPKEYAEVYPEGP